MISFISGYEMDETFSDKNVLFHRTCQIYSDVYIPGH